jgi:hypothetical protein
MTIKHTQTSLLALLILVTVGAVSLVPVPVLAVTCDLTAAGNKCTTPPTPATNPTNINGALFFQSDPQPTGSGVIQSFVRISATPSVIGQGYNTDFRPVQFDENTSPTFTRSLPTSSVPIVIINGTEYREFGLDVNQVNVTVLSLESLDKLQIFQSDDPMLHGYSCGGCLTTDGTTAGSFTSNTNTPVYDMDTGAAPLDDNWIKLDYQLNSGSGSGDMFAYIPNSLFNPALQYVTLYSKFGIHFANNDGYEEWWVRGGPSPSPPSPIPEPASLLLLGSGLAGLSAWRLKRRPVPVHR